ncbi:uncharacterized protein LOC109726840 [Ananas comosus]|uniref:Uncharacterized protein LOC109726840 n=1 Tax=Ananas comosus TaxID=4615 RepID=A0A6P5H2F4_ANACO|nr:uncharacterized protein LOC109726840 [Ananas comosus]
MQRLLRQILRILLPHERLKTISLLDITLKSITNRLHQLVRIIRTRLKIRTMELVGEEISNENLVGEEIDSDNLAGEEFYGKGLNGEENDNEKIDGKKNRTEGFIGKEICREELVVYI